MSKTNLVWVVLANSFISNPRVIYQVTNLPGNAKLPFNLYLELLTQCLTQQEKHEIEQPSTWSGDEKWSGLSIRQDSWALEPGAWLWRWLVSCEWKPPCWHFLEVTQASDVIIGTIIFKACIFYIINDIKYLYTRNSFFRIFYAILHV